MKKDTALRHYIKGNEPCTREFSWKSITAKYQRGTYY